MTEPLPEPRPTDTDGQREQTAQEIADALIAAVNQAMPKVPTHLEDGGQASKIPTPPPVDQPGSPPMTPRETQIGRVALYGGAGISLPILSGAVFMVATEHANPEVIAWCAGGMTSLALLVATFGYLVKRIVAAAPPPEIHNHYEGSTIHQDQRNIHSRTSGVWARSSNQQ